MVLKTCLCLLIVTIPHIRPLNLTQFNLETKPTYQMNVLVQIMKEYHEYQEFHLLVYIDNVTQHAANNFFYFVSTTTTIFNQDTHNSDTIPKSIGLKYLHVVIFENPLDFVKYINKTGNISSKEVIIFLTEPKGFKTFSAQYWIISELFQTKMIVLVSHAHNMKIYSICFYCGSSSGKLNFLKTLRHEETLEKSDSWLPESYRDFKGHLMRVAYVDYFPFVHCINSTTIKGRIICSKAEGSEYELLRTLGEILNFTYELVQVPNQTFIHVFNGITLGDFDFGIGGLTITNERGKFVQYSKPIRFADISLMFTYKKSFYMNLLSYLNYKFNLNAFTSAAIFFSALLLFLFLKYIDTESKPSFGTVLMVPKSSRLFFDLTHFLQTFVRTGFEQPAKLRSLIPKKFCSTFLVFFSAWWIFSIVINTTYRSKLAASMISKPVMHVTLQELVDDGYEIVMDNSKKDINVFVEEEQLLISK
jgi:ABC-type amino acid transport substrate-binding protein